MTRLKRVVGFKSMIFLCINAIIGTGLFFLPSIGAYYAGPASLISWIVIGALAILMSFIFAELVSIYPKAGGVFEYAKQAFGEFESFMTGWISWLVANVTISMLIVGALYYIMPASHFIVKIAISIIILTAFNIISYRGMKTSTMMLIFFSILTMMIPISLIIGGAPKIDLSNLQPFFVYPLSSIFVAMFFISETFIGWESITFLSEEAKNPKKNMPIAIILSTLIIVLISILLVFVSLGVMNWQTFSNCDAPFSDLSRILFGPMVESIISFLIFFVIIGAAASWIISTPRLLLAMSREKLFLKGCHLVHEKYNTPHMAILFQTIVSIFVILMGLGNYKLLLSLLLPLVIVMYLIVLYSFIKLRKIKTRRPFKSPVGVLGAYLIAAFYVIILFFWFLKDPNSIHTMIICTGLVFLGIPIYILVKMQDRKFIEFFFDHLSGFYNIVLPFWYGKREKDVVIKGAKIKKGYKVLDYGCGGGSNLLDLSEDVGKKGKVVGVDISKKQLEACVRRVAKFCERENVIMVKEEGRRTEFGKNIFDAIISVGVISYQENPLELLKELRKFLKPKRRISILEFGKSLFVSPPEELKNKNNIRKLFKKAGFKNIKIKEKKKLFTKYYFITAEK